MVDTRTRLHFRKFAGREERRHHRSYGCRGTKCGIAPTPLAALSLTLRHCQQLQHPGRVDSGSVERQRSGGGSGVGSKEGAEGGRIRRWGAAPTRRRGRIEYQGARGAEHGIRGGRGEASRMSRGTRKQ